MKYLFILLLLTGSKFCFSQYYLGLNYKEAYSKIALDEKLCPKKVVMDKDISLLTWDMSLVDYNYTASLFFDNPTEKSYMFCISPKDNKTLSKFIEIFNEDFVVVSKDVWHSYTEGITVEVQLTYIEYEKRYAIYFTML